MGLLPSGCAPYELLHAEDGALDARLRVRVVVLDALQQLAQAPVRVRLRARHHLPPAHACTLSTTPCMHF